VDEVQRKLWGLALVGSLAGCMGPHDTVLMADEPATVASHGGSGGTPASSGASGMNGSMTSAISSAPSAGSAAASGGSKSEPPPSTSAGSVAAPPRAGSGGMAGSNMSGSAGQGMSTPMAGSGGAAGEGEATPPAGATDADCDFTGVWAGQQMTVSEAIGVGQTSNNWYLLEIEQSGDAIEITNSFDCGIEVQGSATVTLSKATLEGELPHNHQNGRKGTLKKVDGKCVLDVERFWSIRGADEMRFLPAGTRNSMMSIPDVAKANPLPTPSMPDGAVDTENDGKLGIAFQASGIIEGTRNSVQRDWTRWFTESGYEITPAMDWTADLTVRADFDNEESVMDASTPLLSSLSTPSATAKHVMKFHFLGRDRSDARAVALIKPSDTDTCYAIQDMMKAQELK
jgi:hypothetical protein